MKKVFEKFSNEHGITLVALVITIVIIIILAVVTINFAFGEGGIVKQAQSAADYYANDTKYTEESLSNVTAYLNGVLNGSTIGGNDESEFLPSDRSYNELKGVNTPDIKNGALTPIVWNEDANARVKTTGDDKNWYSYTITDKKWANAVVGGTFNDDGTLDENATGYGMFVWRPRFAYQISDNYHNGGEGISGTINIKFMKGTNYESADGTKTQNSDWDNASGEGNWNIHPAFEYDGTKSGIWVAKFEASSVEGNTDTEEGDNITSKTLQIKPGVASWRNIQVSNIFDVCKNYRNDLNSHLMKNSEWGAVAYLSQSSYGKNSEVWINPNSNYITGQAGTSTSLEATTDTYAYSDTTYGINASTTGTIYGIYDMNGGSYEYVSAYVDNGNEYLTTNGSELVNAESYMKDIYSSSSENTQSSNYNMTSVIYGDAIYEVSSGTAENGVGLDKQSWYGNCSSFPPVLGGSFLFRGGSSYNFAYAGMFSFNADDGNTKTTRSFRPVLVID